MNPDQTLRGNPELRKVILAAFIGTVIEWYDFFLYGYAAAIVFGPLFFPTSDPSTATIEAFATYAVGFLGRPLGGMIFGYIGDRFGRKVSLVWTLSIMGASTCLVGCLPTYAQAAQFFHYGPLAPILLVAVRFIQGIAVGGEWGGAVLLSVESGHRGQRGFLGSWTQAGVPAGSLIATGALALVTLLRPDLFLAWGWRLPFLFGIVLTFFGFIVRHTIQESPLFQAALQSPPSASTPAAPSQNPLLGALADWRSILIVIGARLAENSCFYIFTAFILSYGSKTLGIPKSVMFAAIALTAAVEFFVIPLYGILSDRFGRRPIYAFGAVSLLLLAYPFFWVLQTKNPAAVCAALVVTTCLTHAAMYAPQAAFFSELFGTRVRFSGVSLGYQLSSVVAGGCAPLIAAALLKWADISAWPPAVYLKNAFGPSWAIVAYLMTIAAITALTILLARETHKTDIAG